VANNLPRGSTSLSAFELAESELALEAVSREIELVLEIRRLESEASSKQNFTGKRQLNVCSCKGRIRGSRRRKPEAA